MKLVRAAQAQVAALVAPLAGAWIETLLTRGVVLMHPVAPLAGAWIETPPTSPLASTMPRRPPRGGVD